MYIGPQGIVHGTTITILNALRKIKKQNKNNWKLFLTSGLGGMSGAQPKAAKIAGITSITAEVNKNAIQKRYEQGWIDEIIDNISDLVKRIEYLKSNNKISSIGFLGNIVEIWEEFQKEIFLLT